jgi:inorganic pyrophosphatase
MSSPECSKMLHMVNEVPYRDASGKYQMVVEIPAGTIEKWQTDAITGQFYHDRINGQPRIINFLPYPMNYGMLPQTLLAKENGGDGDPTDIITLAPAQARGTISQVRIIGALRLSERGETDTKIVALLPGGPFPDINDLPELLMRYPGAVEIIRLWFEGYKGAGSFLFQGYANRQEAQDIVEASHQDWLQAQSN